MTTKAKDGRETLQESRTYLLWINKNDQHFAVRILDNGTAVVEGELAPKEAMEVFVTEAQKQRDAAQAEIARLESDNTRLRMKLLAAEFDANIPADVRTPLPVAEDVEEQIKQAFESFLQDIISCVTAGYRLGFEYQRERMFRELILPLLRQPEAAPGGWQLVPKTPDENMIRAYKGAVKEYIQSLPESERQHTKTARGGYPVPERIKATVRFAAMLASAPTPASAVASEAELSRLQAVIERDRTRCADIHTKIQDVLRGREWLRLGRGSYEWNDDRWKDEFGQAIDEIQEAVKPLASIACDLTDSPRKPEEVKAARASMTALSRDAGLEEAAEYHSSEARRLRADAKRYAESNYKPNHELVVPVTRQAENHEYFARNIRSLKSASTPAPASAQRNGGEE